MQYNEEKAIFSTNDVGTTRHLYGIKRISTHTSHRLITWKWITDLNAKAEFLKLLQDNKGEYLCHLEEGKNILGKTQKAPTIGEKNNTLDVIKMKDCSSKRHCEKINRHAEDWEEIFTIYVSDKGPGSRI